jgi:hypothetical protein
VQINSGRFDSGGSGYFLKAVPFRSVACLPSAIRALINFGRVLLLAYLLLIKSDSCSGSQPGVFHNYIHETFDLSSFPPREQR